MKKQVKTISRRTWEKIKRDTAKHVEGIPDRKVRIKAHAYADYMTDALHKAIKEQVIEVDCIPRKVIYRDSVNLGSRRYQDYCADYYEMGYKGNEQKRNIIFIYR